VKQLSSAGWVRATIALTLLTLPSMATAQSKNLSSLWFVMPTSPPAGEQQLAGGEFVLKQRLLPSGLAELETLATVGKQVLPAGIQLVEAQAGGAKVFCVPDLANGTFATPCLIDADKDGAFDSWFKGVTQTKSMLMLTGRYPKEPKPIAAARYREVSPLKMRSDYFVAIERRNFFNIYSRESFMIAFGSEGRLERLTTPASFKSEEMPRELNVLGSRFTAISEHDGKMLVRVSQAMPLQPFVVSVTTTYR
jgi:hypothetical protein